MKAKTKLKRPKVKIKRGSPVKRSRKSRQKTAKLRGVKEPALPKNDDGTQPLDPPVSAGIGSEPDDDDLPLDGPPPAGICDVTKSGVLPEVLSGDLAGTPEQSLDEALRECHHRCSTGQKTKKANGRERA